MRHFLAGINISYDPSPHATQYQITHYRPNCYPCALILETSVGKKVSNGSLWAGTVTRLIFSNPSHEGTLEPTSGVNQLEFSKAGSTYP